MKPGRRALSGDPACQAGTMTAAFPLDASAALDATYAGITDVVGGIDDVDLLRPTRCRGLLVADLLVHLLADARRALLAFANPVAGPPDTDAVSYWRRYTVTRTSEDLVWDVWRHRRAAAAFERPDDIVDAWAETSAAAVGAARAAPYDAFVATQGRVLAVPDFVATLVTEAAVHHLDLIVELPEAPSPAPVVYGPAVTTLDGLLGDDAVRPVRWGPAEYLLKATGRVALDERDRTELGPAAIWFPLLG
ncbi:maleylpyruvate isomerase N-terminal domain-containing protein [Polymorphospora rubra]|uniref:Maleylpyruvate isomerase n=2 Tax=Polymorphospora rubra TaxID=338584 RepID=A0A810MWE3_9ACTN|nr:maleylpyruvate isomerase [Polymorphospora rubra]